MTYLRARMFRGVAGCLALLALLAAPGGTLAATMHSHPHDISDASGLLVPPGSWPVGAQFAVNRQVDPTLINDAQNGPVANAFHSQHYVGVTGGYWQVADVGLSDKVYVEWLGTYYGSTAEAQASYQDALGFFASAGITGTGCTVAAACTEFKFSTTSYDWSYAVFQNANGLGEVLGYVHKTSDDTEHQRMLNGVQLIEGAGSRALNQAVIGNATNNGGPPSISITRFSLLLTAHEGVEVKSLHSGEKGTFLVNATVKNAGTTQPTGTITIKKGAKTVFSGPATEGSSDITTYFRLVTSFKVKKSTRYTAIVVVTVGSASDTASFSFKVTPKKKK